MKTELVISVFEKIGDEGFIKYIDISHYDLKKINVICPPYLPGDFQYCDGHFVTEDQFIELKKFIIELKDYDYVNYDFDISTVRVD